MFLFDAKIIADAITKASTPLWLTVSLAVVPIFISLFVFWRQNKIMKQQNDIELFEKRYELYLKIEFILKNIKSNILIITSMEFIKCFGKMNIEPEDNEESENNHELFITYMQILFWGSANTMEKIVQESNICNFFHSRKKKELEKYRQRKAIIEEVDNYSNYLDKINSLFVLSKKEKDDIKRIKELLKFLEQRTDIFGLNTLFRTIPEGTAEDHLKELGEIISDSSLLETLKKQVDLQSKSTLKALFTRIKEKIKGLTMKHLKQDTEKQSHETEKNYFITILLPLFVTIVIAGFQIYISITQVELSKQQNLISSEQSKITDKQLEIMNQQNNIALFDKRLKVYNKLFIFYSTLETVCSENYILSKKRLDTQKAMIEENPNRYILADLLTSGDFTKRQEVINDKTNILLIDYTLEIANIFEQIMFLFALDDKEHSELHRIIRIIYELERKVSGNEEVKMQSELVWLKNLIENGLLKTIISQLYITNSNNLENE